MKKKIMIFCDFYLPSYKSGGGMWTVVNLADRFCHLYDFYIVTRNYDSKGDKKPYTTVKADEWNQTGNAKAFYFSAKNLNRNVFAKLVNEIKPDVFFLNSVFATPVIKFLVARRSEMFDDAPLILAPCGELSAEALALKSLKKRVFLKYAQSVNLYRNVIWKASGETEKEEITKIFGRDTEILIAPDLTPKTILPEYVPDWKLYKEKGVVKFVFVSRIVRKKNIHFFLERLREIKSGNIEFKIIGPPEDADYVRECLAVTETLPKNISVSFTGAFSYGETLEKLAESHFFVLPTLNENFGYVCIESLAAGSPLLISDRTVWNDVERHNAGWEIPLEDVVGWNERIEFCLNMNNSEYKIMSQAAREYAIDWLAKPELTEATAKVLRRAVEVKSGESNVVNNRNNENAKKVAGKL